MHPRVARVEKVCIVGVLAAVAWSILYDLADPYIFVPAIVLGWFARSVQVVVAGATLIAIVSIGLSLTHPLPDGAERVIGLEPIAIIAPLVWSYATFRLRQWLLKRDCAAPGSLGARALCTALGVVLEDTPRGTRWSLTTPTRRGT